MFLPRPLLAALLPLCLFGPIGCGWVDATGRQAGTGAPDTASPEAAPIAASGVPVPMAEPDSLAPIEMVEGTSREVRLAPADARLRGWSWHPLEEVTPPAVCATVDGFDTALAEGALGAACSDPAACTLGIDELEEGGETRFRLRLPALRAPLAARFALRTLDPEGRPLERFRTLCAASVNEAPFAADDRLSVAPGELLDVRAGSVASLLANDSDDDDVRNRPLAIDPTPARAPRHAERFELDRDGGFRYLPRADIRLGTGETLEDGFAYTLSDGLHDVVAEVVIVIVGDNRPPVARASLPERLEIVVGERDGEDVGIDLARFFEDPDGDALSFSLAPGSLPPSGNLALGQDGVLGGRASLADVGVWRLTLRVSDGSDTLERELRLEIVRAFESNRPPSVVDIANVTVRKSFTYDVAPFFDDPDGDRLAFSARGLPPKVKIDAGGRIKGKSRRENRGSWFVVVTADDGRGGRADDGFRLTIE